MNLAKWTVVVISDRNNVAASRSGMAVGGEARYQGITQRRTNKAIESDYELGRSFALPCLLCYCSWGKGANGALPLLGRTSDETTITFSVCE